MLKEGRDLLKNENSLSMVKVWLVLEVRQFINASIQDVRIIIINERVDRFTNFSLDPCFGQGRHVESKYIDMYIMIETRDQVERI